MQVTHVQDYVTHAVIGNKAVIDFDISNSPEFFNILSSTLYSDQQLAVVREVLCNAWDAHIDAGVTDQPVQVSFKDNKFVVRDFGKGIHHDNIGPIYGTYGNSTKKNDGKQTGGFGLGCKAPFAYTDHFEVISYHQGVMTIYAMSKSSAAVNGKPGIIPIVSAPTHTTGLQVTINIKNNSDLYRFKDLVEKIASEGDMNVMVEGEQVKPLGFTNETNFMLTQDLRRYSAKVCVRYGNVIYPVAYHEAIDKKYNAVCNMVDRLTDNNGFTLLFQAEPHSISVTPSRETLSMQEHTCQALNKLFDGFLEEANSKFDKLIYQFNNEIYEKPEKPLTVDSLLSRKPVPVEGVKWPHSPVIRTIEQGVKYHLCRRYPEDARFRKQDLSNRLKYLLANQMINKALGQSLLRDISTMKEYNRELDQRTYLSRTDLRPHHWFQQNILKPIAKQVLKDPKIELNRLFVSDHRVVLSDRDARHGYSVNMPTHVPITKAIFPHLPTMLPYTRNTVVLAYSRLRATSAMILNDVNGNSIKVGSGFLLYIVNRRKDDLINARSFFQKLGMNIIDYTTIEEEELKKAPPRVVKPRRKGLAAMDTIHAVKSNSVNLHRLTNDGVEFVEDPKFFLRVYVKKDCMNHVRGFSDEGMRLFFKHFGKVGGIITTTRQEEAYNAKGIPSFEKYADKVVAEYIKNSSAIADHWAMHPGRMTNQSNNSSVMRFILGSPYLSAHFKLAFAPLSTDDKEHMDMMRVLMDNFHGMTECSAVYTALESIPLAPEAQAVIQKIDSCRAFNYISMFKLVEEADNCKDPKKKEELYEFFLKLFTL